MMVNLCPACRRIHASDAVRCASCGCDLGEGDSWSEVPDALARGLQDGALWLDELGPLQAHPVLPPVQGDEMHLDLGLREIDAAPALPALSLQYATVLSDQRQRAAAAKAHRAPPGPPAPGGPPPRVSPVAVDANGPRSTVQPLPTDAVARSALKVARRGEVRRARLRAVVVPLAVNAEVLVLDPDAGTRAHLRGLLQNFGFAVTETSAVAHASLLTQAQPFVAAFVDVSLDAADGGAGIDLCRRIRQDDGQRGATTLLVLLATDLTPVDRVRADLAGFDDAIGKPATRGSVAAIFDSRGMALPTDPRRV